MTDRDREKDARDSGEPTESAESKETDTPAEPDSSDSPSSHGPLSGLREDIEARRDRRANATPDAEDVFETGNDEPVLDGEQVWEDLLEGQADEAGMLAFGEQVEDETADVRIIPDRICHNCKYFADPPDLHCTHDGTEIRRVVDMDHYEVVDCPVVKHRSDLDGQ